MNKSKQSPFKFLDSYKKQDIDIFFGRDNDTEALYDALRGVKHLLVYGPSGSGKSSLIECGLRNQFSDADWFALTIRKGKNINSSVYTAINDELDSKIKLNSKTKLPLDKKTDFVDAVKLLYDEFYQPIYLLFDQFEELLISGTKIEKERFFKSVNKLIKRKIPGRIILIMREEFIGHLSEFEYLCPSIFQYRFRVEKMGRKNIRNVLNKILSAPEYLKFFTVSDKNQLVDKILSTLPDKRREIELSHLQVFLAELWDRANRLKGINLPQLGPHLIINNDNLEKVLDGFLKKQLSNLKKEFGDLPIEVLNTMISEENTKLQLGEDQIKNRLIRKTKKNIKRLLEELEANQIIRNVIIGSDSQYEISHDTLALVVGRNKTQEMIMRERASKEYDSYSKEKILFWWQIIKLKNYKQYKSWPKKLKKLIVISTIFWYIVIFSLFGIGAVIIYQNLSIKNEQLKSKLLIEKLEKEQEKSDEAIKKFLDEKTKKDRLLFNNLKERVNTIIEPGGCPASIVYKMDSLVNSYNKDSLMIEYLSDSKKSTMTDWKKELNSMKNKLNQSCQQLLLKLNESNNEN
ncbi:AAA family ATPase [Winogradskyella sp.]|uniref:nSTAND1 domain-containing NTPase n=1 Tax=Winogradskyella sp. TaxID=1883156 RepID=UPI003BA857F2